MKALLKEINVNGYSHCDIFDVAEMFDTEKVNDKYTVILFCNTVSTGVYSSTIVCPDISKRIAKFIREFGMSEIIINDEVYTIDIREKEDFTSSFKAFSNFREAFSYCRMENSCFWNNIDETGVNLSDLH